MHHCKKGHSDSLTLCRRRVMRGPSVRWGRYPRGQTHLPAYFTGWTAKFIGVVNGLGYRLRDWNSSHTIPLPPTNASSIELDGTGLMTTRDLRCNLTPAHCLLRTCAAIPLNLHSRSASSHSAPRAPATYACDPGRSCVFAK